jgi:hypothetical protein
MCQCPCLFCACTAGSQYGHQYCTAVHQHCWDPHGPPASGIIHICLLPPTSQISGHVIWVCIGVSPYPVYCLQACAPDIRPYIRDLWGLAIPVSAAAAPLGPIGSSQTAGCSHRPATGQAAAPPLSQHPHLHPRLRAAQEHDAQGTATATDTDRTTVTGQQQQSGKDTQGQQGG